MLARFEYPAAIKVDEAGFHLVTFPDLPEAATDGKNLAEALVEAADCLGEALAGRIVDRETVPSPSTPRRGHYLIALEETLALKIALNQALAERGVTIAELARRLDCDHKEARRLLDPRAASKVPRLTEALAALDYGVRVEFYDATKHVRLLSAPIARTAQRTRRREKVRTAEKRAAAYASPAYLKKTKRATP
jgi:antitoxin HicB